MRTSAGPDAQARRAVIARVLPLPRGERVLTAVLLAAVVFDGFVIIGGYYFYGRPVAPGAIAPEFAEGTGPINRLLTAGAGLLLVFSNPLALLIEMALCAGIWWRTRHLTPLLAAIAAVPVLYWLTLGPDAGRIWSWVLGY